METPIAALEEYGLPVRTINALEKNYGLYIKCIQTVTSEELARCNRIGPADQRHVKNSLKAFFEVVKRGEW